MHVTITSIQVFWELSHTHDPHMLQCFQHHTQSLLRPQPGGTCVRSQDLARTPFVPSDGHIRPHHRPGLSAVEADAAAYVASQAAEAPGSIDIAVLDVFDGTDSTPPSLSSPGADVPSDQITFRSCTGITRPDRSAWQR